MSALVASVLIFVAAGLLALSAAMASQAAGREPPAWTSAGMAAMLGLALGFILQVVWISPLGLFPIGLSALLIADWGRRRKGGELGAFLMGGGAIWVWAGGQCGHQRPQRRGGDHSEMDPNSRSRFADRADLRCGSRCA
jgi:hypothetical protein